MTAIMLLAGKRLNLNHKMEPAPAKAQGSLDRILNAAYTNPDIKVGILRRECIGKDFFLKDAEIVAKGLLGCFLVHQGESGILSGKIVETEAYLGIDDPASHSYQGKITPRNKIMYEEGGTIYVYSIYGVYLCFNIVVSKKNDPQAVFIRALEPITGKDKMVKLSGRKNTRMLTNGPAKWVQALGIDKSFLGTKIYGNGIFILRPDVLPKSKDIVSAPRVGIDYAGRAKNWKLRFYLKNNPYVSRK